MFPHLPALTPPCSLAGMVQSGIGTFQIGSLLADLVGAPSNFRIRRKYIPIKIFVHVCKTVQALIQLLSCSNES